MFGGQVREDFWPPNDGGLGRGSEFDDGPLQGEQEDQGEGEHQHYILHNRREGVHLCM